MAKDSISDPWAMRAFHPDLSGPRHSVHIPAALSSPCTANTCSPNLEGSERKYRALLNAFRVGFAVFDRDGCIIVENTLRENIDEEILLIENLELKNTKFFCAHPSNAIPVNGYLPKEKEEILSILKRRRDAIDPVLSGERNTTFVRAGEGVLLVNHVS